MYRKSMKAVVLLTLLTFISSVYALDVSTTALPYESWLKTLQKSLSGPVALSIAIIGIVSCGATLIFSGGEINRVMRSIVYLVMVMTLLVGANNFMTSIFGVAAADHEKKLKHNAEGTHENLLLDSELKLRNYIYFNNPLYEEPKERALS